MGTHGKTDPAGAADFRALFDATPTPCLVLAPARDFGVRVSLSGLFVSDHLEEMVHFSCDITLLFRRLGDHPGVRIKVVIEP